MVKAKLEQTKGVKDMLFALFSVWTKPLLLIPQLVIWDFGLLNPSPTNLNYHFWAFM